MTKAYIDHVTAATFSVPTDGTTNAYTTISNALTTIGALNRTLYFGPGSYCIGTNLTIPANVTVEMAPGAVFTDNAVAAKTLTINGTFKAGDVQCFSFSGVGSSVTLAANSEAKTIWWCSSGTGTYTNPYVCAVDTNAGLQSAHDSGALNITLPKGYSKITSRAEFTTNGTTLKGEGHGISFLLIGGAVSSAIQFEGMYFSVSDFSVIGSEAHVSYAGYRKNVVSYGIDLEQFDLSIMERIRFEGILGSAVRFHRCIRSNFHDLEVSYCGDTGKYAWFFDQGTLVNNDVVQGSRFTSIGLETNYNADVWYCSSGVSSDGAISNTYDGWRWENAEFAFCDVTVTLGAPAAPAAVTITGGITATLTAYQDTAYGKVMKITSASAWTFSVGDTITGPAGAWTATIDRLDNPTGRLVNVNDAGRHRIDNMHFNRPGNISSSNYSVLFSSTSHCVASNLRFSGVHPGGGLYLDACGYWAISGIKGVGSSDSQTVRLFCINNSPEVSVNGGHISNYFGFLLSGAASDECVLSGIIVDASGNVAASGVIETESTCKCNTIANCTVHDSATTGPAFKINGIRNQLIGCKVVDCTALSWGIQVLNNDTVIDSCQLSELQGGGIYLDAGDRLCVRNCSIADIDGTGILLDAGAEKAIITNNMLYQYARDGATYYGMYINGDNKTTGGLIITGNSFDNGTSTPTNDFYLADTYTNCVITGNNFEEGTNVYVGSGNDKKVLGNTGAIENILAAKIATVTTSGTGEDDLMSCTLPRYSNQPFSFVRISAAGTKTGVAGNKTLKLYIGTDAITFHPAANDADDWTLEATVTLYSATSHRVRWTAESASSQSGYDLANDDLSAGDLTIKITGECADAGDSIAQQHFIVEVM